MSEKNTLKNTRESFVLVGQAKWSDKNYVSSTKPSDKGWVNTTLNFGVKTSSSNTIYVGLKGGRFGDDAKQNSSGKIFTKDSSFKNMEVAWTDRFDKNIIDSVAWNKKVKVELEKDSAGNLIAKEFLSADDAIPYIKANLKKDDRIFVAGTTEYERYKDKKSKATKIIGHKYINHIRLALEDEVNTAHGTTTFYFDKDSFSKDRFKDEKKYEIVGYHSVYDRNVKASIPLKVTYIIDCSNVDFDNESHVAKIDYLTGVFTDVKKNKVYSTQWRYLLFEGAEVGEITKADMSKDLLQRVELGFITMEEAEDIVRKNKVGDRIKELRLSKPIGSESKEEVEDATSDDLIAPEIDDKSDKADEIKDKIETDTKQKQEEVKKKVDDDFDELFGGK